MNCKITHCTCTPLSGELFCLHHFTQYETLIAQDVSPHQAIKQMLHELRETDTSQSAADFLEKALGHLKDRGVTYDKPQGERSMGKTVAMFNELTGHTLTEEQGWKFMVLLKLVRSEQGAFKADNFEDGSAYFALAGESASTVNNFI